MSTEEQPSEQNLDEQKSLSPTTPDSAIKKRDGQDERAIADAPPSKMLQRIEQFSAMMQVSPGRDPFVEKMTPEHVTAVIANKDKDGERKHTEELAKITSQRWYFAGGGVFLLLICLLFLAFGKTEHLDAVLAAAAGLAGGFGIGRASAKEKHHA